MNKMNKMNKMVIVLIILIILIILIVLIITNRENFSVLSELLKSKDINFLFLVRDGEEYLKNNLNKIIELGTYFKSYKIFFIENDSKDGTVNILKDIMKNNSNIIGEFRNINEKASLDMCENSISNCNKRIRFLASLRQDVLNESLNTPSDLTVILDLDFITFDKKQFLKMIGILYSIDADAIFGMSYHFFGLIPYDVGAVIPMNINMIMKLYQKNMVLNVKSAFSGFGVYQTERIKKYGAKYDLNTDTIEHISFNKYFNKLYIYTSFRPNYTPLLIDRIKDFFKNIFN